MKPILILGGAALALGGCHVRTENAANLPIQPTATREIPWSGATSLDIDLPSAEVVLVQGETPRILVEGAKPLVDRVAVNGGDIDIDANVNLVWTLELNGVRTTTVNLDGRKYRVDPDRPMLKVTVTAPTADRFELSGGTRLTLQNYAQPSLRVEAGGGTAVVGEVATDRAELELDGGARANLSGAVKTLRADLSGGSNANLRNLAVDELSADLSGGARARFDRVRTARIDVSGGAHADFDTRPETMEIDRSGGATVSVPGQPAG